MNAGIFLWEELDGTRCWEAFASWEELKPFLESLLNRGLEPKEMMLECGSLTWMFPSFHKGCKTVWNNDILDIQKRTVKSSIAKQIVPDTTKSKTELGWISPDGRYFPCEYGMHSEMARKIVGHVSPVSDARSYLENNGWLAVYKNPVVGKSLAVGMGKSHHHISNQQLDTLHRLGICDKIENLSNCL